MELLDRIDSIATLVKTSLEIVKSGGDPRQVITDLRERLLDLKEGLLDAREEACELRDQNLALKQELDRKDAFDAERTRYELRKLASGSNVYALIEDLDVNEWGVEYFLCVQCFDEGRHSKLQFDRNLADRRSAFVCGACGSKAVVAHDGPQKS